MNLVLTSMSQDKKNVSCWVAFMLNVVQSCVHLVTCSSVLLVCTVKYKAQCLLSQSRHRLLLYLVLQLVTSTQTPLVQVCFGKHKMMSAFLKTVMSSRQSIASLSVHSAEVVYTSLKSWFKNSLSVNRFALKSGIDGHPECSVCYDRYSLYCVKLLYLKNERATSL